MALKKQVRVTPQVQEDLLNIGRYTERIWGRAQRVRYLKSMEARFEWLAENPMLGKHRVDINESYYSFPEGKHIIFYLITDLSIDIIGIPHKEMDIINYFS